MRGLGFACSWFSQPSRPSSFQFRVSGKLSTGEAQTLASTLAKQPVVFELNIFGDEPMLIVGHPGLGVRQIPLDQSGEPVIRHSRLDRLILESEGNSQELKRLLRIEQGLPWLDLLEQYRNSDMRIEGMLRAV
jgi:hypothetical protein